MPQFVDRRLNPRDKSLGNRQRFLRRTRARSRRAVDKAVASAPSPTPPRVALSPSRPTASASRNSISRTRAASGNTFGPAIRSSSPATASTSRRAAAAAVRAAKALSPGATRTRFRLRSRKLSFSISCSRISSCQTSSRRRLRMSSAKEFRRAGYSNDGSDSEPPRAAHDARQHEPPICASSPDQGRGRAARGGACGATGQGCSRARRRSAHRRSSAATSSGSSDDSAPCRSSIRSTCATIGSRRRTFREPRRSCSA